MPTGGKHSHARLILSHTFCFRFLPRRHITMISLSVFTKKRQHRIRHAGKSLFPPLEPPLPSLLPPSSKGKRASIPESQTMQRTPNADKGTTRVCGPMTTSSRLVKALFCCHRTSRVCRVQGEKKATRMAAQLQYVRSTQYLAASFAPHLMAVDARHPPSESPTYYYFSRHIWPIR